MPELPYPMYTAAMNGMIVTFSGLEKAEKEEFKHLVERMAGICSNAFHDGVTHLVVDTARSQKYEVALRKDIHCMLPRWVEEVWKVSSDELVTAMDPRFSSHRCPGLLKKSVATHGGVYSGGLEMDKTTLIVCTNTTSEKYNDAKKLNIPCIGKGYCLQTDSSNPTEQDQNMAGLAQLNSDEIVGPRMVVDTINCTAKRMDGGLVDTIGLKTTADWLAELEPGKLKKAGSFLDGCKIFLSGFTNPEQVQLTRVLQHAGGVKLTQLVESVTHCMHSVGNNKVAPETGRSLEQLDLSPYMVSIQWVVESMKLGTPVTEADYKFPVLVEPESFLPPPTRLESVLPGSDGTKFEANLLAGSGAAPPVGDQISQTFTDTASRRQPFLVGLKLELAGFDEEMQQNLTDWVTEAGGELVYGDFSGVLDFLVVPVSGGSSKNKYKKLVSSYWLEDCLDAEELLSIKYHHHPLVAPADSRPLVGVVTCLSGYDGKEMEYLNLLVDTLGGTAQEIFVNRDNELKGAKGSTHLLCPEGAGQKYTAAMKWGLPVVTRDWVTTCHREMVWVSEKPFLVGEVTAVPAGKPMPSLETEMENMVMDKTVTGVDQNIVRKLGWKTPVPGGLNGGGRLE